MTHLPAVRHIALEHRGVNRRALHLHFARPLDAHDQMLVLSEVAFFHALRKGPVFLPEFPEDHGEIVLLNPATGQDPVMDEDFQAAARYFGYKTQDGILPFVGQGQCSTVSPAAEAEESLLIADPPLLRQ